MDNKIHLSLSTHDELIKVYNDEYIAKAFQAKNNNFQITQHHLVEYYSIFVNSEFMGIYMVIRFSKNEIEIHSLLFKKAIIHSIDLGKEILKLAFSIEDTERVTALILSDLHKAKNYVKKLGFIYEGTKRNALYREDNLINVDIFGITKEEFKCQA